MFFFFFYSLHPGQRNKSFLQKICRYKRRAKQLHSCGETGRLWIHGVFLSLDEQISPPHEKLSWCCYTVSCVSLYLLLFFTKFKGNGSMKWAGLQSPGLSNGITNTDVVRWMKMFCSTIRSETWAEVLLLCYIRCDTCWPNGKTQRHPSL